MRRSAPLFLIPLMLIISSAEALGAEAGVELEPIVITHEQSEEADEISTRATSTVEVRYDPPISAEEILDYESEVDILRRGILGVQSDISIRGSTGDQVQISVNGIIVNDPQTEHHNLDLNMPLDSIERIDIVGASGPTAWAQGAIGGAVNFVTKKPTKNEGLVSALYGTDETQKTSLYLSRNTGSFGFGFSAEEASSNGWRHNTDFKEFSLASSGLLKLGDNISSSLFASYGEKEFGAANFYGPYNSREWTDGLFIDWELEARHEKFLIRPKAYFKRHHDKYELKIEWPDYYRNHHRTDIEGVMLQAEVGLDSFGRLLASVDMRREDIKSNLLGKDTRYKNTYFLSWQNYNELWWGFDASLGIDDYSEYDAEVLPQAGVYLMAGPVVKFRSSVSRSARQPTYTELLYDSPSNKGSKDLSLEKAMNYDIGLDVAEKGRVSFSCTVFRRDADNLIDWVKETPSQTYYQARNMTEVKAEGVEIEIRLKPVDWFRLKTNYAYIDSDINNDVDYISKYALNHPDHKVSGEADIILPCGTQTVRLMYKNRKDYAEYFTMGLELNYGIIKGTDAFINIDNIFNSTNEDIKDNPLPGREIQAGVKVEF